MLQITVHNRGRVPIVANPSNAAGPAALDVRVTGANPNGRAIVVSVNSGDGSFEDDPNDPYAGFAKPVGTDLAIGDPPRVTLFDVIGDADLTTGVSNLTDQIELTHLPPDGPPPSTALCLTASPSKPHPSWPACCLRVD